MKQLNTLSLLAISWILLTSCYSQIAQETPQTQSNIETQEENIVVENTTNSVVEEVSTIEDIEEPTQEKTPEYLLIQQDGSDLVFERVLSENSVYTRYQISYTSEGFTVSGIMNIPKWDAQYPLLILNHGYIDPAVYTNGRWLKREQDYFARNGFAVLHTDYRNHAFSDNDPSLNGTGSILRSKKYGADAINAVLAVQNGKQNGASELEFIDSESVGMLGHSMGGWVTMYSLVAASELIDAAVLYAPVHSNEFYNYQRWGKNRLNSSQVQELNQIYGNTDVAESFGSISPESYFQNITAPIQMYFGTNDQSCPIAWWYEIESALESEWKDIDFIVYNREQHEFWPQWQNFMEWSSQFFSTHLSDNE